MRVTSFRYCMLVGALALSGVALFYFINYAVLLDIALGNSGVKVSLQNSIRAMWLAFGCQALLMKRDSGNWDMPGVGLGRRRRAASVQFRAF